MSPSSDPIYNFIRDIARQQRHQDAITESTDLIQSQILDSVNLVKLILVIQDQFGLEVSFTDLEKQNFKDLATIRDTIDRLKRTRE